MNSVHWVNPDSLRISDGEVTGLLRFEGDGIELNVEIYGGNIPNTIGPYVTRAIQLLDIFHVNIHLAEPEPEPSFLPDLQQPEPEESIWPDFILPEYLYYHPDAPLIEFPEFQ